MELKTLEKKTSLGNFRVQFRVQISTQENGVQNGDTKKSPLDVANGDSLKPSLVTLTWESLLCMDLPQVDQHSAFRIGQVLYMEDTSCRFDPF